jgi:dienelactone hydrolase
MIRYCRLSVIPALFLLVACGERAATPPAVESSPADSAAKADIRGDEITYESGGTVLKGYLAYDASQTAPRPGVLVVHEWWGHNDYVRERARLLAGMGYVAFALDMYGDGKLATHPDDAQKFMMEALADMPAATGRFMAAMEVLQNHASTDPEKIAAIGYCFGGAVVLHMARIGTDLDAVASFHGSLGTSTPASPGVVSAKVLVAHGADDPLVPPAEVEAFKAEMEAAGVDLTFVAYPGAVHSFTRPDATVVGEQFDMPLRYDESADKASWAELEQLLAGVFGE